MDWLRVVTIKTVLEKGSGGVQNGRKDEFGGNLFPLNPLEATGAEKEIVEPHSDEAASRKGKGDCSRGKVEWLGKGRRRRKEVSPGLRNQVWKDIEASQCCCLLPLHSNTRGGRRAVHKINRQSVGCCTETEILPAVIFYQHQSIKGIV